LATLASAADSEEAKRFDLLMHQAQLASLTSAAAVEPCRKKIVEIASALQEGDQLQPTLSTSRPRRVALSRPRRVALSRPRRVEGPYLNQGMCVGLSHETRGSRAIRWPGGY